MAPARITYKPTPNAIAGGVVDDESVRYYNFEFSVNELPKLRKAGFDLINLDLTDVTFTEDAVKVIADFVNSTLVGFVAAVNCGGLAVVGGPNRDKNAFVALLRISKSLENAKRLTTLNLSGIYLGDEGLEKLRHMFNRNSLQHVDVSSTDLKSSVAAKSLVSSLKKSRQNLTHVSINNNERIGADGAEIIGAFLATCPRLMHVELGNVGAAEGGHFLANGLLKLLEKGNQLEYINLKGLRLESDYRINQEFFEKFVSHGALRNLKYLDVSNSGMKEYQENKLRAHLLGCNRNLESERIVFGVNDKNKVTEESQFVVLSML